MNQTETFFFRGMKDVMSYFNKRSEKNAAPLYCYEFWKSRRGLEKNTVAEKMIAAAWDTVMLRVIAHADKTSRTREE